MVNGPCIHPLKIDKVTNLFKTQLSLAVYGFTYLVQVCVHNLLSDSWLLILCYAYDYRQENLAEILNPGWVRISISVY